jgi:nitrogen fixation/metabolism regulation signal transduction histidine kinase
MLSANSTTVAIENTQVTVKKTSDFIFPIIIQTIVIVTIFSAIATSILTLFISHKIAGPLFRLRREIEKLGAGNLNVNFSIREGDQLKNLATSLGQMACSLRSKIEELHIDFIEVERMVENIPDTGKRKQLEDKLKDIEAKLSRFKGS